MGCSVSAALPPWEIARLKTPLWEVYSWRTIVPRHTNSIRTSCPGSWPSSRRTFPVRYIGRSRSADRCPPVVAPPVVAPPESPPPPPPPPPPPLRLRLEPTPKLKRDERRREVTGWQRRGISFRSFQKNLPYYTQRSTTRMLYLGWSVNLKKISTGVVWVAGEQEEADNRHSGRRQKPGFNTREHPSRSVSSAGSRDRREALLGTQSRPSKRYRIYETGSTLSSMPHKRTDEGFDRSRSKRAAVFPLH